MPTYRCPKHDQIFDSVIDHRAPGSAGTQTLPAHPRNGHPDCPACQVDPTSQPSKQELAKAAAFRAKSLKDAAAQAQKQAELAAQAAADAEKEQEQEPAPAV